MDRVAAFVDAGYLFAAGAILVSGQKRPRGELLLDYDRVLDQIASLASTVSGLPLLRIYWYDGTSTGPTPQQLTLAFMPRVKLRLGYVDSFGEQKGVDSLLVTDLITLARNRAIVDALLLTGDEDIRVGVQQAQEFGVRVHLLGIEPSRGNQSQFLVQEADTLHEWTRETVAQFLRHVPPTCLPPTTDSMAGSAGEGTTPAQIAALDRKAILEDLAKKNADLLPAAEVESVLRFFASLQLLPPEIDRLLLGHAKNQLGVLDPAERRQMRQAYAQALQQRQTSQGTHSDPA